MPKECSSEDIDSIYRVVMIKEMHGTIYTHYFGPYYSEPAAKGVINWCKKTYARFPTTKIIDIYTDIAAVDPWSRVP